MVAYVKVGVLNPVFFVFLLLFSVLDNSFDCCAAAVHLLLVVQQQFLG